MKDEKERRPGRPRGVYPVVGGDVTGARGGPLPPRPDAVRAEEPAPDGLEMAVPAPPGWAERRGDYSCPCNRSFTISGAISRARWSSSASVRFAIGCGISRNLYVGTPHCFAIARPVTSKTSVTIAPEGSAFLSSRMPSSTLPDEQDPQSPMPATMTSQDLRIS